MSDAVVDDVALPVARRQTIMMLLESEGQVLAGDLSHRLHVSEDTIRRDLRELANAGLVTRVHGGAVPKAIDSGKHYPVRQGSQTAAKLDLAQMAIGLIQPGQVVILDAGTTNLQIARILPADMQITVVTNCPPIAVELGDHPCVEVIMSGGRLNKAMQALTGVAAVSVFQGINADLCFLGACALHPEAGICSVNEEEVHVKRAMLASAAETVVVVTADKLGAIEPFKIDQASSINYLITESCASDEILETLSLAGTNILRV